MNNYQTSRWILWSLVGLFMVLALALWVGRISHKPVEDSTRAVDASAATTAFTTNTFSSNLFTEQISTAQETAIQARLTQVAAIVSDHNRPISFFGRVVDQDGLPLEGAKVVLNYRGAALLPAGKPDTTFVAKELVTDADGRFQMLDARGDALMVESIAKPGYQLSPKARRGFTYRHDPDYVHRPDINNPVIYRMWKLHGTERVLTGDPALIAPATGDPVGYNFSNFSVGQPVSEQPDIIFRFQRPPEVSNWTTHRYDWRLEVSAVAGGLIEHNDELPYAAPASGYRSNFVFDMKADDSEWRERHQTAFYLRGRNGRLHARLELRINSKSRQGGLVSFHYAASTNGSRNLEYDPRTQQVR